MCLGFSPAVVGFRDGRLVCAQADLVTFLEGETGPCYSSAPSSK